MSDQPLTIRRLDSNHWSERAGQSIGFYIVHGADAPAGTSLEGLARYLKQNDRSVSAHEAAGGNVVYRMVEDSRAAHHCGGSRLPDGSTQGRANQRSWGIEGLQIHGQPMDPITRHTVLVRVAEAMKRNGHGAGDVFARVRGHREVDLHGKTCPGPDFDMDEFRHELVAYLSPVQTPPAVNMAKIIWALEEGARILQREGLQAEHDFIVGQVLPRVGG